MVAEEADLSELPAIGEDLGAKIATMVETGSLPELEALKAEVPGGLVAVLGISGLGPKRVQALHEALGIDDIEGLRKAAEAGKVREVEGFGEKTEANILHELDTRGPGETRTPIREAEERAEPLVAHLKGAEGAETVTIAGSYRRRKETVGDLDILVACEDCAPVMERFAAYEDVAEVISRGETRSTVVLGNGLQVDLRAVAPESHGAALHYFTGSKAHNIHVRRMGQGRGLKINEYGVFEGDRRVAGATEEEVYDRVGLPWILPELREDRGEIEAAAKGALPELVALGDIRGNLHAHTDWSDGSATARGMAGAARDRGWDYLAITDHSKAVRVANGLDADRLARQIDEIDALNDDLDGIAVLKSVEVDILEDGTLDLPDDILSRLDFATAAIHSHFALSREKQTARILKAMDNARVSVLAHPTGRMIGKREGYPLDMEAIVSRAADTGVVLEINAQPQRLDLDDAHARMAVEAGAKLSIGTDAHAPGHLDFMRHGVDQARRGWVSAADVVNTRSLSDLRKLLRR
jgi:DNA polymerase (family 10)